MTREEAKEQLNELKKTFNTLLFFESVTVGNKKEFLKKNIKALDAALVFLENERPEGKWIPVSERLPTDDFGRYIITVESDDIYGAIDGILYPEVVGYYGGTWKDLGGKQIADEVISWMPLPETYKESEVE